MCTIYTRYGQESSLCFIVPQSFIFYFLPAHPSLDVFWHWTTPSCSELSHRFLFFAIYILIAFLRILVLSVVLVCLKYCSVFSSVSFNKFCIPASQPVSIILLPLLILLQVLVKYLTYIACLALVTQICSAYIFIFLGGFWSIGTFNPGTGIQYVS